MVQKFVRARQVSVQIYPALIHINKRAELVIDGFGTVGLIAGLLRTYGLDIGFGLGLVLSNVAVFIGRGNVATSY